MLDADIVDINDNFIMKIDQLINISNGEFEKLAKSNYQLVFVISIF